MTFEWNSEKNEWLKRERGISFEDIIFHLSQGDVWRISDHPDAVNHPGQRLFFVIVDEYIYLVPHVQKPGSTFLKTIIPSRKATKLYRAEKET